MKILHTADWHLGHRFSELSQFEEQSMFLSWLKTTIINQSIDVLLVSGDIFDTATPSSQSQKLYYDFLVSLLNTNCKHIVITGGNHDSPGVINAPKALLNALNIKVVGKAEIDINDEVFTINVNDESVIIGAVPYLRDQDIRRAVAGETFTVAEERYKYALINHYNTIAECMESLNSNAPKIAMGHLFAVGGTVSDSEQQIYVGNLGHIGADDFPKLFDYVALGHLHRPQIIGGNEKIRYSGSPNILSFSEINYDKKVLVITTNENEIIDVSPIVVPEFRIVKRITGTINTCIEKLPFIQTNEYNLTPWVEVVIDNDTQTINSSDIYKATENLPLEIVKVTLKNKIVQVGLEELISEVKDIKELKPLEVFELKCKEEGLDIKEHSEIYDAFNEALQIAQNN